MHCVCSLLRRCNRKCQQGKISKKKKGLLLDGLKQLYNKNTLRQLLRILFSLCCLWYQTETLYTPWSQGENSATRRPHTES